MPAERNRIGFPESKRFETYLRPQKRAASSDQFGQSGYQNFKTEVFTPKITWIYLRKERT